MYVGGGQTNRFNSFVRNVSEIRRAFDGWIVEENVMMFACRLTLMTCR